MKHGFHIRIDQLADHAGAVEDFASRAGRAAGAGQQVASMGDAYGLCCRPIGWLLAGPQQRCTELLARCAHALRPITSDLRSTADAYQRLDVTAAGRLSGIGRQR